MTSWRLFSSRCLHGMVAVSHDGRVRTLTLPLLLLLLQATSSGSAPTPGKDVMQHSVGSCFNQSRKHLRMTCDPGHMVKLDRIYFGHSSEGSCGYTDGDCTLDAPDMEHYPCVGQRECDINLPSGGLGSYMPKCEAYSNYMQAEYECIPETDVIDICDHPTIRHQQRGYIKTPRYPTNYPDSRLCDMSIVAPDIEQTISVYIVDLNLENNGTACLDWLHLHDGFRSYTLCNMRSRRHAWTTASNVLRLTFHSNHETRRKGFWLHFEALPYITPPTTTTAAGTSARGSTTTATNNTALGGTPAANTGDNQVHVGDHHYHISYSNESSFPIGLVVGVVIGAVLCILLVLLIVILLKRREAAKVPVSISCTSTTAFLEAKQRQPEAPSAVKCINNDLKAEKVAPYQDSAGKGLVTPGHVDGRGMANVQEPPPPYTLGPSPVAKDKGLDTGEHAPIHYVKGKALHLDDDEDEKSPYININMRTGEEQLYC